MCYLICAAAQVCGGADYAKKADFSEKYMKMGCKVSSCGRTI